MVRVNCQYNVGGFRLFKLFYGKEQEYILSEKAEYSCDAPKEVLVYINVDGCKCVYQHTDDGQYVFIVRGIPSIHHDDYGRATECAVIFSGDEGNRKTMDNIAINILNNIEEFQSFFTSLFRFSQGLNVAYDGDKLSEYISEMSKPKKYIGDSKLKRVVDKKGKLILFVPKSNDWSNYAVQEKVCRMLRINAADLKSAIVLTQSDLQAQADSLTIQTIEVTDTHDEHESGENKNEESGDQNSTGVVVQTDVTGADNASVSFLSCMHDILSSYIEAWTWILYKKGKEPKCAKAFVTVHVLVVLLMLILIICTAKSN